MDIDSKCVNDGRTRARDWQGRRPIAGMMILLLCLPTAAQGQDPLWMTFAHPDQPHHYGGAIQVPELFDGGTLPVMVPTIVVLLDYVDQPSNSSFHTPAFFQDMVFGSGAGPYSAVRPSMAQIIAESLDGMVQLVPAAECEGMANDGVVGWVTAQCPDCENEVCGVNYYSTGQVNDNDYALRRAEAIRRIDPFVEFAQFDQDMNDEITRDELLIVLITSDPAGGCDAHAPAHGCSFGAGQGDSSACSGCNGSGATVRGTDPAAVAVDCTNDGCCSAGQVCDPNGCCATGAGMHVRMSMAAVGEGIDPSTLAHEIFHSRFGLGDLYSNEVAVTYSDLDVHQWTGVRSPEQGRFFMYHRPGGAPYNNASDQAIRLADGDYVSNGFTDGANGSDESTCGSNDWRDVWFDYTPGVSEVVGLDLVCADCHEQFMDTSLALFEVGPSGNLVEISGACVDNGVCGTWPCSLHEAMEVELTAGQLYKLRVAGWHGAEGRYRLRVRGGRGSSAHAAAETWFPNPPNSYSMMASHRTTERIVHVDPWSKMHLGSMRPQVVTHDGYYFVHRAEPQRSFAQQAQAPEAVIIYDPLKNTDGNAPEDYYFMIENRHLEPVAGSTAPLIDSGLAVWVIDETLSFGSLPENDHYRRNLTLRRRDGGYTSDTTALWDDAAYDLTPYSSPANTAWADGTPSFVEISDISPAGPVMSFFVRMPPVFVDAGTAGCGSLPGAWDCPFAEFVEAIEAVASQDLDGDGQQDGPRTIELEPGIYFESQSGAIVIEAPCTVRAAGGSAVIM